MSKFLLMMTLAFGLMSGSALAEKLINKEAEKIMVEGKLLNLAVLYEDKDDYVMLMLYKKKLYTCYHTTLHESLVSQRCTFALYKEDK